MLQIGTHLVAKSRYFEKKTNMTSSVIIEKVYISGQSRGQYLASASLIIADGPMRFLVRGLRIIDLGRPRNILAMPAIKKMDDNGAPHFDDMFSPLNEISRAFLEDEVFRTFEISRK